MSNVSDILKYVFCEKYSCFPHMRFNVKHLCFHYMGIFWKFICFLYIGIISSNGQDGDNLAGGASGGSILLTASSFTGAGQITANGGKGRLNFTSQAKQ